MNVIIILLNVECAGFTFDLFKQLVNFNFGFMTNRFILHRYMLRMDSFD
jgi:hypothetical protein